MKPTYFLSAAFLCAASLPLSAYAHDEEPNASHAADHAPIGVMGDHRHDKGEWMLSYRYMNMKMGGNRLGTGSISSETIVTTIANPTGMPALLRVVPEAMTMDMHMIGAMYGLSDNVTLMAMINYQDNDMDHTSYQGMMGTAELGEFNVQTGGMSDTIIGAIIGLKPETATRQFNLKLALSLPTGSIKEQAEVLTPMNTRPTLRSPYAMQLGTGTYDFMPAVTLIDRAGKFSWGAQLNARLPLDTNAEGYHYGNQFGATSWLAYELNYGLSFSARLNARTQDAIKGRDASITAPVQTANPDNYGGQHVSVLAGVNWLAQSGALKGHRLALEYGVPVLRDLNGPQMDTNHALTLGWQKAF